jgi:hypothetical protein
MISSQASVWWFHKGGNSPRAASVPLASGFFLWLLPPSRRLVLRERSLRSSCICPRGNFTGCGAVKGAARASYPRQVRFRSYPECLAAGQLSFLQCWGYRKGVIRCAYEQLPQLWWSQRHFSSLKVRRPQRVGVGVGFLGTAVTVTPHRVAMATTATRHLSALAMATAVGVATATGVWVGGAATATGELVWDGLGLVAWALVGLAGLGDADRDATPDEIDAHGLKQAEAERWPAKARKHATAYMPSTVQALSSQTVHADGNAMIAITEEKNRLFALHRDQCEPSA